MTYEGATRSDLCSVWRMIASRLLPFVAAVVANPARSECAPNVAGSGPGVAATFCTMRATLRSLRASGAHAPIGTHGAEERAGRNASGGEPRRERAHGADTRARGVGDPLLHSPALLVATHMATSPSPAGPSSSTVRATSSEWRNAPHREDRAIAEAREILSEDGHHRLHLIIAQWRLLRRQGRGLARRECAQPAARPADWRIRRCNTPVRSPFTASSIERRGPGWRPPRSSSSACSPSPRRRLAGRAPKGPRPRWLRGDPPAPPATPTRPGAVRPRASRGISRCRRA